MGLYAAWAASRQQARARYPQPAEADAQHFAPICKVSEGMDVADKLKKAPPGSQSGTVTNPDKMIKVQVASDMK